MGAGKIGSIRRCVVACCTHTRELHLALRTKAGGEGPTAVGYCYADRRPERAERRPSGQLIDVEGDFQGEVEAGWGDG